MKKINCLSREDVMKKLLSVFCAAILLLMAMPVAISASDAKGMTFDDNSKYEISKNLEKAPVSVEAWVELPTDAGRAGVVFGNYGGTTACINFEITTAGRPRMYVVEYTTGEKVVHDVAFKEVDVRKGEPVHVAVTYDETKGEVYCYVNGELKQTIANDLKITDEVLGQPYVLGGDRRGGNAQYFKGVIETVAVYSDLRSAEEIKAAMKKVNVDDDGLIAYYDALSISGYRLKDESKNGYDAVNIVKWIDDKEPVTDYAYSFCVVGDTQVVTEKYPDKLASIYDWIIENKDEKKIEFVFGLGDITNKNTDAEWTVAKEQIFKLNGVVPYSIVRGNHDGSAKLNEYFAKLDYMLQFDGFYDRYMIDNSWRTFSVGNTDYLLVNLDFGPSDTLLDWAAGIIEAHPEHKVIITTHCYLFRDGTTLDAGDVCPPNKSGANDGARNNGDQMWDKLVSKYENIFLVLSGHDPCSDIIATQTAGDHGNIVTQMLIDPQSVDTAEGATGMVAMLYFSEDGKTLTVEQYSTVNDKYYMSTSQFTLPLPESFAADAGEQPTTEPEVTEEPETEPVVTEPVVTDTPETEAVVTEIPETEPKQETEQGEANIGADIGIIGGADGPTAIFVAGQIWPLIVGPVVVVAAIGGVVGFLVGRRKK